MLKLNLLQPLNGQFIQRYRLLPTVPTLATEPRPKPITTKQLRPPYSFVVFELGFGIDPKLRWDATRQNKV